MADLLRSIAGGCIAIVGLCLLVILFSGNPEARAAADSSIGWLLGIGIVAYVVSFALEKN
jgi:hypothetical protein